MQCGDEIQKRFTNHKHRNSTAIILGVQYTVYSAMLHSIQCNAVQYTVQCCTVYKEKERKEKMFIQIKNI